MAKKTKKSDTNPEWLSTYGILTAEGILDRFKIKLSHDELLETLKDSTSRHYHLLTLPLKNIFNGILVTQVHDYQVYAQKLLIDYNLSKTGTPNESEEEQTGTHSEEELLLKQGDLMGLGEAFDAKKQEQKQLIAESQAWLIHEAPKHNDLGDASELAVFGSRVEDLMFTFQNFRTEFRTLILDITSLLNVVPGYSINEEKLAESQESLDFDSNLEEFGL
ncbi:MAG: hypothetical protein K0U24_00205 [Gammaproteobacteria bacterium]|nr:hypothetical protein [Gammaproteobacteria bacterium]MCH9762649.1 hypothetical protein [Gammaproteobacteria bacterium]